MHDEERLEDDLDARFAQVSSEGRAEVRDGRIVGLGDGDDGAGKAARVRDGSAPPCWTDRPRRRAEEKGANSLEVLQSTPTHRASNESAQG